MTILVNFLGAANSGKSVLAADCYSYFSKQGKRSYLIPEYIKTWALQGFPINEYRELAVLGQQSLLEEAAYGQYDFLFSESPLELISFYSDFYSDHKINLIQSVHQFHEAAQKHRGVQIKNYFLKINPNWWDKTGRYENLDQALEREDAMFNFMRFYDIPMQLLENRDPAHLLNLLSA